MKDRMTAGEFRLLPNVGKRKYRNQRCEFGGFTFDSKAEARYYATLKQREKIGEISDLKLQPKFILLGADGSRLTSYRADFSFQDHIEDRHRIVDVKGVVTQVFLLKQRLMKSNGLDVEIVKV